MNPLGSPPHLRGTLRDREEEFTLPGITPAPAGNTLYELRNAERPEDHPRTCGEHYRLCQYQNHERGSPPHLRGTPAERFRCQAAPGITPAPAGNTAESVSVFSASRDHPRTCGEHLQVIEIFEQGIGSPPHLRGTPRVFDIDADDPGITPAPAGNTGSYQALTPTL